MSEAALVRLYWQLTEIETTCRSIKTELGMRPVFHQQYQRIQAYIGLSILAYYGVHSLRSQLKRQGCHESWSTLRKRVGHRVRLTTVYLNEEGQCSGQVKLATALETRLYFASALLGGKPPLC